MSDAYARSQPPDFIQLLAHELRWNVVSLLTLGDYRVHELVERLGEPMNLVSYHLKKLRDAALVVTRRSEADGRDVYYSLDQRRLAALYHEAGAALCPALSPQAEPSNPAHGPVRVLFVCTHNSARSQMAEALLRHFGGPRVQAFSAGSRPDAVHPDAIQTMQARGIDIHGQRAKALDTYAGQPFDYVITVCDRAREACPAFPGGVALHWGYPDPTGIPDAAERQRAFARTADQLSTRIQHFLTALPAAL